jgi:hypothetical protein
MELPGMMVHACIPSTQGAEGGESQVGGQPGLHMETLSYRRGRVLAYSSW